MTETPNLTTLLGELDAKVRQAQAEMLSRPPYYGPGTMALVNAYPALRAALQAEYDANFSMSAELTALHLENERLRTLLAQRTEALRDTSRWDNGLCWCSRGPDDCDTTRCMEARAALTSETGGTALAPGA